MGLLEVRQCPKCNAPMYEKTLSGTNVIYYKCWDCATEVYPGYPRRDGCSIRCAECGEWFERTSSQSTVCKECKDAYVETMDRKRSEASTVCGYCGGEMKKRIGKNYCSRKCRWRANRKKAYHLGREAVNAQKSE